ncbi:hypothetical protein BST61_g10310 [Cercospora zeina]
MAPRRHVHNFSSTYHHAQPSRVVEIFTDGSFKEQTGGAGCAFVFDTGADWFCRAFAMPRMMHLGAQEGSKVAEKQAILMALDLVKSDWAVTRNFELVRLRVDTTFTMGDLAWEYWSLGPRRRDPLEDEIVDLIRELLDMGVVVQMEHVERVSCRGSWLADWYAGIGRRSSEMGDEWFVLTERRPR